MEIFSGTIYFTDSVVFSDTWKGYTVRGYIHRFVYRGKKEYCDGKGIIRVVWRDFWLLENF